MSGAFQSSFNSVDHTWSLCDGRAYRVIEEDWMGMQESVNTLENQHQSADNRWQHSNVRSPGYYHL